MRDEIADLVGCHREDLWRKFHKDQLSGHYYGGNGDFFLYEYISNAPRIVALLCLVGSPREGVNDTERALAHDAAATGYESYVLYAPRPDAYPQYVYPLAKYDALADKGNGGLAAIQVKINNAGEWKFWEDAVRARARAARRP